MSAKEISDPGPLPELKWLPKDVFIVDQKYQRNTDSTRSRAVIEKIVESFRWARFQPPSVMPGPEGKYIVIDGQHRIAAALRRSDVTKIPVYVIEKMSIEDQAMNFVAINRDRAQLHPLAVYKALLMMADPMALQIKAACEEAGITIAKQPAINGLTSPRETAAVGSIKLGINKYGAPAVIAALKIISEVFPQTPGMMRSVTLKALMAFFKGRIADIDRDALKVILLERNPHDREYDASEHVRIHGGNRHDSVLQAIEADYSRTKGGLPAPPRKEIVRHGADPEPQKWKPKAPLPHANPKPEKKKYETVQGKKVEITKLAPGYAYGYSCDERVKPKMGF